MNEYIEFLNKNIKVFKGIDRLEINTNAINNKKILDFYLSNSKIRYEFTLESIANLYLSVKLDENFTEYSINIPGIDDNFNVKGNNYLPFFYFECVQGHLIFKMSDIDACENKLMPSFSLYLEPTINTGLLKNIIFCFNKILGNYGGNVQMLTKDKEYFKRLL